MARISSYPKDTTIQDNDAWVGTASPNRQTKNFLASDVAKYLNIKGKISISAQMVYEFKSDPNEAGTGDFYGVSDNTDFSTITSLNISATDKGNQNVVNFITYLVDSDILISEQKNISSFGHYKITAYTDNGDGFYTLTLSYLGGGGSVGNKKFYDIANFSIAKLGDITAVNAGTYLNGGGSSGDVTLNHDLTSRTNTTSSVTPGYGGTFTAIDSVVTNTTGHITTVNTKTVTIPDSGVDGNGTTNYVAKWLDTDTIQNSIIFDNGTNVGIGTASPSSKLEVDGNIVVNGSNDSADGLHLKDRTFIAFSDAGSVVSRFRSSASGIFQFQDGSYNTNIVLNNSGNSYLNGGNVGIGTTSPSAKLEVNGNIESNSLVLNGGTSNSTIYMENGNGANVPVFQLNPTTDNLTIGHTNIDQIRFHDDSGEAMRLDGSGNLGIGGTTNPSQKLHVTGNARVTGAYYDSNNTPGTSGQVLSSTVTGTDWVSLSEIQGVDGTGTANYVAKWSDTDTITNSLIYDNGTNVGIGTTTTPNFLLDIEAPGADMRIFNVTSNANTDVYIRTTGTAASSRILFGDTADPDIGNIIYRHNSDSLAFTTNSSEAMRITSAGNVGIGITSPSEKLEVIGVIKQKQGSGYSNYVQQSVTEAQLTFSTSTINQTLYPSAIKFSPNGSEAMRVDNAGNVGIGTTSPSAKLDVNGPGNFSGGSFSSAQDTVTNAGIVIDQGNSIFSNISGNYLRNIITHNAPNNDIEIGQLYTNLINNIHLKPGSSGSVIFQCSGSEDMRVAATGNVGINTTNPQRKLEVVGKIRVSDIIEWGWGGVGIIGSTTTNDVRIKTWNGSSTQDRLIVNGSGNVGIGTTSPGAKLDINGDSSYSSNYNLLSISGEKTGGTAVTDVKGINLNIGSNDHIVGHDITNLYGAYINNSTSGSSATIISNWYGVYVPPADPDRVSNRVSAYFGDKVGIGTTNPTKALEIGTNGGGETEFRMHSDISNNYFNIQSAGNFTKVNATGNQNLILESSGTGGYVTFTAGNSERMRVNYNGRVGIATTNPQSQLQINGGDGLTVTANDAAYTANYFGRMQSDYGTNALRLVSRAGDVFRATNYGQDVAILTGSTNTGTSERMRITIAGNVGIGTTTPGSKLDVVGYIKSSNNLTASTIKYGKFLTTHYNISEQDVLGLAIESTSSNNNILIGGGFSSNNTATTIKFFTAANSTTTTGSEKMRITSDGNVGIGTNSPIKKLHVNSGSTNEVARLESTDAVAYLSIMDSSTTYSLQGIGSSGDNLILFSNNAERMRVDSSGRVNIGTTTHSIVGGAAKMTINVGSSISSPISIVNGTTDGLYIRRYDSGGKYQIQTTLSAGNSGNLSLQSYGGNVGVGILSPSVKFHVTKGSSGFSGTYNSRTSAVFENSSSIGSCISIMSKNTGFSGIFFGDEDFEAAGQFKYDHTDNSFRFLNLGGVERMRITSSGNVGIGTTDPNSIFEIKKDVNNGEGAELRVINNGTAVGTGQTSTITIGRNFEERNIKIKSVSSENYGIKPELVITQNQNATGSSHTEVLRINSSGNVGIGTNNPLNKLHISTSDDVVTLFQSTDAVSKIEFADNNTTGSVRPSIGASGNNTIFTHGATERMRIASDGNVGIGTTSPAYKLDVNGGVRAGGVITYSKSAGSLDTTGYAVAGLTTGSNGNSTGFTFTCFGHTGKYQKIVYSCYNGNGTWYPKKVIDEGTNDFDIEASADAATITFTFKSTSGTKAYTPRVTVEATGHAINSTYA